MKNLLNRLAARVWDRTTSGSLTIDDLTYAVAQAEHWQAQWVLCSQAKAQVARDLESVTAENQSLRILLRNAPKPNAPKLTATKAEAVKAPKERRSRRSGPIKD